MGFFSRARRFFFPSKETEQTSPTSPVIPMSPVVSGGREGHWTSRLTPRGLLMYPHLTTEDYAVIRKRSDLVWQTWKMQRIARLETNIVVTGKSLKGHGRDAFAQVVVMGEELEYLRPEIDWRRDTESA